MAYIPKIELYPNRRVCAGTDAGIGCCAMLEIDSLSAAPTPTDAFRGIWDELRHVNAPFIIFTGVTQRKAADDVSARTDDYGQAFEEFIYEFNLGDVHRSNEKRNKGSNVVRVWIWEPDYVNVRKLGAKLCPEVRPEL